MSIDDMKVDELKRLVEILNGDGQALQSDKIGKYVVVRCRDAGVHAGVLASARGRSCSLKDSRRLWYWKPANGASFLSGVAAEGLHPDSKVGAPVDIDLTENCEIILCSETAAASIEGAPNYEK